MRTHPSHLLGSLYIAAALAASFTIEPSASAAPKAKSVDAVKKATTLPKIELKNAPDQTKKVASVQPLTKDQKLKVLAESGVQITTGALAAPTVLSVRNPYANATTYLSFVGSVAVLPGQDGGVAMIEVGLDATALQNLANLFNFGGSSSSTSDAPHHLLNFAAVEFRAAAGKHYIVDCSVAGSQTYMTQLVVDDRRIEGGMTYVGGHVVQHVPAAATERAVKIQFLADSQWTLQRCEVTPAG